MDVLEGFYSLFSTWAIVALVLGTLAGLILGAIPGLTTTMTLAILAPLTFGFDTTLSIVALIGIHLGGIAGGAIPAISLNIPGTPASAATALDGYQLTLEGKQKEALNLSFMASSFGGVFSALALIFFAPYLANFGLHFSSPEYFALGMLGLIIIISVAGESIIKGIIVAAIGYIITFVGLDSFTGMTRFTFGFSELDRGISFIPLLIGLYGLSEVLLIMSNSLGYKNKNKELDDRDKKSHDKQKWKKLLPSFFRSSTLGTGLGVIPGVGSDIAAWTSYDIESKFSKKEDPYKKHKSVIASEGANNANSGGAFIPMMTFGIPGDAQTAIFIGFLITHGLSPGPSLYQDHSELVYIIFSSILFAAVLILIMGLSLTNVIKIIISKPLNYIYPPIILFCIVGAYAVNNNAFDILVMFFFGIVGVILRKANYPLAPMILALVLGPLVESNLRRGLILVDNNIFLFFERPIFIGIFVLGIILLSITLLLRKQNKEVL